MNVAQSTMNQSVTKRRRSGRRMLAAVVLALLPAWAAGQGVQVGAGGLERGASPKTDATLKLIRSRAAAGGFATQRMSQASVDALAPAGRMVREDGRLNVTIHFDAALTIGELDAYELAGVEFMRLPKGKLANFERYYPAWVSADAMELLETDSAVEYIEPGRAMNAESPLDQSRPEIQADVRNATRTWGDIDGNRGQGVKVAVFDTGIDIHHPDFFAVKSIAGYDWIDMNGNGLFDRGFDRVDLNRNGVGDAGEALQMWEPITDGVSGLNVYDVHTDWLYHDANGNGQRDFGTVAGYDEQDDCYGEVLFFVEDTDGDNRLDPGEKLRALGRSKVAKVLVGDTEYVRGVNLIDTPPDTNGHGTSVCSIIAGQDPKFGRRFAGVSPDVDLYVIDRYANNNHLTTLVWARDEGCRVMLWEFGSWTGHYMDGTTALENAIATHQRNGNILQVLPNGNLGGQGRHAQTTIAGDGGMGTTNFSVPSLNTNTVRITVVWTGGVDTVRFDLRKNGSPNYWRIDAIPKTVEGDYGSQGFHSSNWKGTHRFDMFITRQNGQNVEAATWNFRIMNTNSSAKTFHLFIDDDDPGATWGGGVEWTTNVSDASTVAWPATADDGINAGSYASRARSVGTIGQLSDFSGRGPRIDGFDDLLDVTAPGHYDIWCAQSQAAGNGGFWGTGRYFGGTSAAGPHVTGAVALLIEAVPWASPGDIVEAVRDSSAADGFTGGVPNQDWGHGKLRIDDAYRVLVDRICPPIADASGESPADGTYDIEPGTLSMSWQDDSNAGLYDLHLGTTNPPARYVSGLIDNQFQLAGSVLAGDTTYYWQIVARNSCGNVVYGPVWSFETSAVAQPGPEIEVFLNYDEAADEFPLATIEDGGLYEVDGEEVGQSRRYYFGIRNTGDAPLHLTGTPLVSAIGGHAAEFEIDYLPTPIVQPGTYDVFRIKFQPSAAGLRQTNIYIYSDDFDETPYNFLLRAEGFGGGSEPADSDGDGVADDEDVCPGEDDLLDTDGDGVVDCQDEFPLDPNDGDDAGDGSGDDAAGDDGDTGDDAGGEDDANGDAGDDTGAGDGDFGDEDQLPDGGNTDPNSAAGADDGAGDAADGGGAEPVDDNQDIDAVDDEFAGPENADEPDSEVDEQLADELNDLRPLVPAPCGFGMTGAYLACMLSLVSGQRTLLKRRAR